MKYVDSRPLDSSIVSIGAGAFIIAIGLIAIKAYFQVGDHSTTDLALIITGTLAGAAMIGTAFAMIFRPARHKLLGGVIIILSLVSFAGTSGGLYLGAVAGILAGLMSISWRKKSPKPREAAGTTRNS